eukprot:XP_001709277.1 Hypothetical protein GL50803_118300 [Giardia lamblia ATCC 50803]
MPLSVRRLLVGSQLSGLCRQVLPGDAPRRPPGLCALRPDGAPGASDGRHPRVRALPGAGRVRRRPLPPLCGRKPPPGELLRRLVGQAPPRPRRDHRDHPWRDRSCRRDHRAHI